MIVEIQMNVKNIWGQDAYDFDAIIKNPPDNPDIAEEIYHEHLIENYDNSENDDIVISGRDGDATDRLFAKIERRVPGSYIAQITGENCNHRWAEEFFCLVLPKSHPKGAPLYFDPINHKIYFTNPEKK